MLEVMIHCVCDRLAQKLFLLIGRQTAKYALVDANHRPFWIVLRTQLDFAPITEIGDLDLWKFHQTITPSSVKLMRSPRTSRSRKLTPVRTACAAAVPAA